MRSVLATAALSLVLAASAAPADDEPVVGYLTMRGHVLTLFSSPGGTLYTVRTREGRVLLSRQRNSSWPRGCPESTRRSVLSSQGHQAETATSSGRASSLWPQALRSAA